MSSVDAGEAERFGALADRWWDPEGPLAPLHAMQPVRLDYLRDQAIAAFGLDPRARRPLTGLRVLDIGCGGGLAAEPMARLGAAVTGVDPSEAAIAAARAHAQAVGLEIDYVAGDAEALAADIARGARPAYDLALALEVVEHATDRTALLAAMAGAVRPGGLAALTTLNRTAKSFVAAIAVAEYALRWLAPGTHDWRKFPPPETLAAEVEAAGFRVVDRVGFVYEPFARRWRRDAEDLSVNYALVAERTG